MASLIEELIGVLEEENGEYEKLTDLSKEKTMIIVNGDIKELQEIMDKEQVHVDKITNLESKRTTVVADIAIVLNKEPKLLTVKRLIGLLKGQKKEQEMLSGIHDRLRRTLKDMTAINEMNKGLIEESLEMINFNVNLMNSLNQMPELGNYSKDAYNVSSQHSHSGFDAKQ